MATGKAARFTAALIWCSVGYQLVIATAEAHTYEVRACDAAPHSQVSSWSLFATADAATLVSAVSCPSQAVDPYADVSEGLSVFDKLGGAPAAPDGSFVEWRLVAPPTTSLTAAVVGRDIGNRDTLQSGAYTPYGRTDRSDLSSETCFAPEGEFFCRIQGVATLDLGASSLLAFGARCAATSFCDGGATLHHVWVSIRSAIVTIDDPVDPLISEPSGALSETGRWHRGTEAVSFSGSDVTGIRQLAVYDGAAAVATKTADGAQAGGCGQLNAGLAYTFTKPCEGARGVNGLQALDVNTVGLGDGTSSLRLVVRDTAGNEAERVLAVQVDNAAPVARVVQADGAWSAATAAAWTWTRSAEVDRAPVAKVEVERCLAAQGCAVAELDPGAEGYSHPVPEGESSLRVRETDAAGNVGAWSEPAPVRRDRTGPEVTVSAPARVAAGEPVSPDVRAVDGLSGVERTDVEVRTDGGAWQSWSGPRPAVAGTRLQFRARGLDRAQNVGAWVESNEVLVQRASEPTLPPVETATPVPTATPPTKTKTVLRGLTARHQRKRLLVRGTLRPATATGVVVVRAGRKRVTGRVRAGRFTVAIRTRTHPSRVTVTYRGDARHAAAQRRVHVRTDP